MPAEVGMQQKKCNDDGWLQVNKHNLSIKTRARMEVSYLGGGGLSPAQHTNVTLHNVENGSTLCISQIFIHSYKDACKRMEGSQLTCRLAALTEEG
jgi:hypothetical protein